MHGAQVVTRAMWLAAVLFDSSRTTVDGVVAVDAARGVVTYGRVVEQSTPCHRARANRTHRPSWMVAA